MISLTLGANSEAIIAKIRSYGPGLRATILKAMNRTVYELQSRVQLQKLEGQVLHHRTGNLSRNITAQVEETQDGVTGIVGASSVAPYGAVHEFGGTFSIPEHMAHWEKGPGNGRIARVSSWPVRAHSATFPERSFLRSALRESNELIKTRMDEAVRESLQ
jgi:phage gpG-like protein